MIFTSSVQLAFRRDAILKAQSSKAWYLLCLAEESMVFTSSVELAFRRDAILKGCDFEGSVEQGMAFTVFSMVFTSSVELAFQRDAILKAQLSKAWY